MPVRYVYHASSRRDGSHTRNPKHRPEGKRQQLEKKLAASQMANELAHGSNNPLEALTNLIYLLQESVLTTEDRERVEEAERQLERITTLVRSILALEENQDDGIERGRRLLDPTALRRYQKRYEEAMHLAAIVEGAQDAIYSKKLDGTILAWNAGAEQLFGYSSSEALGHSVRMLVPREMPDDERTIMEKLRRGLPIQSYETTRLTKAGELVPVSISVSPIFNNSGRVVGASTIARRIQSSRDV